MRKYSLLWMLLPLIALITFVLVACTDTATSSSSSSSSDSATVKSSTAVPPIKAPLDSIIPSVTKPVEKPDPVTGKWKLLMGSYTWTVRLTPRPKLKGEYTGTGTRDTRDENGKIVTMGIGAALKKGKFKAWLGPGFVVCEGRFNSTGAFEGSCTNFNGEDGGQFKAERLSSGKN